MSNKDRISLADNLIYKWFTETMATLREHRNSLSDYDKQLRIKVEDAHELVGRDLTITRKQWNHLRGLAADIESGNLSN